MRKCKRCAFLEEQNADLVKINAALGEWCQTLTRENERLVSFTDVLDELDEDQRQAVIAYAVAVLNGEVDY